MGADVLKVESAEELDKAGFKGAGRVGITAGASTPRESIDEVVRWLELNFDAQLTGADEKKY